MPQLVSIQSFLDTGKKACIIDVRTPKEFYQGHIPGAINIPLFNDDERVIIGTLYKQQGRQAAILKGLELVGPKMNNIVISVLKESATNQVCVHCWRGGMRSGSVAWLLELYGLNVFVLKGGYKSFRKHVLANLKSQSPVLILGGRTGAGKTQILAQLQLKGEQVIDLEKIAHHKGSAFGSLGEQKQPSQEQFENELFMQLNNLQSSKRLWLEDESRLIGNKTIPPLLWEQMRQSTVVYLDVPLEIRINILVDIYGKFEKEQLRQAIIRITKKMGGEQTKKALEALDKNDLRTVCALCLAYYDKAYDKGLFAREANKILQVELDSENFEACATKLINKVG